MCESHFTTPEAKMLFHVLTKAVIVYAIRLLLSTKMETKTLYYAHTDKKAYQNLVKEIITRGKIASKDEREYFIVYIIPRKHIMCQIKCV